MEFHVQRTTRSLIRSKELPPRPGGRPEGPRVLGHGWRSGFVLKTGSGGVRPGTAQPPTSTPNELRKKPAGERALMCPPPFFSVAPMGSGARPYSLGWKGSGSGMLLMRTRLRNCRIWMEGAEETTGGDGSEGFIKVVLEGGPFLGEALQMGFRHHGRNLRKMKCTSDALFDQ